MKALISWLAALCFIMPLQAQENWAVSNIPARLKEGAHAVKRMERIYVDVRDKGKAVVTFYQVISILDEGGVDHASLVVPYSKIISVKSIEGTLYDANGKKVRSLKKNEIKDYSNTDDISLADDNRIKTHAFGYTTYPYTVAYEYEMQFNGLMFMYPWNPVESFDYSVESSVMQVEVPAGFALRYRAFNYAPEPVITAKDDKQLYSWSLQHFSALPEESYRPAWRYFSPEVMLAPTDFRLQDYDGNMATWHSFGAFIQSLNNGRDELPDPVKQQVHALTDGLSNPTDKVKALYQYLQQNTRYISIQLGIGGWQTFDAKYVASKGYGDCKALSNYMKALLKEAGIKAYYTLVKAGDDNKDALVSDFPSSQFNHIILCAETGKDTLWLECTNQEIPAGYLGSFTGDRDVLLVDEQGGRLAHTPSYSAADNAINRSIRGKLTETGKLDVQVTTRYQAEKFDDVFLGWKYTAPDRWEEKIRESIHLAGFQLSGLAYEEAKQALPAITETYQLVAENYASLTGKRMFITPNVLSRGGDKLDPSYARKLPIQLYDAFQQTDTVRLNIPAGYSIESGIDPIRLQSDFGAYERSVQLNGTQLVLVRKYTQQKGLFAAKTYTAFAQFMNNVYKSDRAQLVLLKKE